MGQLDDGTLGRSALGIGDPRVERDTPSLHAPFENESDASLLRLLVVELALNGRVRFSADPDVRRIGPRRPSKKGPAPAHDDVVMTQPRPGKRAAFGARSAAGNADSPERPDANRALRYGGTSAHVKERSRLDPS